MRSIVILLMPCHVASKGKGDGTEERVLRFAVRSEVQPNFIGQGMDDGWCDDGGGLMMMTNAPVLARDHKMNVAWVGSRSCKAS